MKKLSDNEIWKLVEEEPGINLEGYRKLIKEDILKFIKSSEIIKRGFGELLRGKKEVRFMLKGLNYILYNKEKKYHYNCTLHLIFRTHKDSSKHFWLTAVKDSSKKICRGDFSKKGEISCLSWKLEQGIELWSKSGLKFNSTNLIIKEWS